MGKLASWTGGPWQASQVVLTLAQQVASLSPPSSHKLAPSPITSNWASESQN